MATSLPAIDRPYDSVDAVIKSLTTLEAHFIESRDWRGVFVSAYLIITRELHQRLRRSAFHDNGWVQRYLVEFADLYRRALAAYDGQSDERVPEPWRIAFELAEDGSVLVLQDLMLGINAHINHDLPLALMRVGIEPHRWRRQTDHTLVNDALKLATEPVQDRLSELYAPELGLLDRIGGAFDEMVTNFSFKKARSAAWSWGELLVDAPSAEDLATVRNRMELHAARLAKVIAGPSLIFPGLTNSLCLIEEALVDWRVIFAGRQMEPQLPS